MSNTKKILVVAAGILFLVAAYILWGGNGGGPGGITMRSENGSGEKGYAQIVEVNSQAFVKIFLSGKLPAGVTQPASIYNGSCANPGAYKYTLTGVTDGYSETVLGGTLARLRTELPLFIRVSKDTAATSGVACGDIKI